jgi:CRISPR/Cas system-associated exonuclease Cas4 (RecB family)
MPRTTLKGLHNILSDFKEKQSQAVPVRDNQIPPEVLFLNSLNKTIEKANTKKNLTSQTYKPSSLQCIRKMYYQVGGMALGEELKPDSAELIGIGESGTSRHIHIQEYITKMKEVGYNWEYISVKDFVEKNNLTYLDVLPSKSEYETKLNHKELNMNFMCDGLLKHNDDYYVFEYKTETSRKWIGRSGVSPDHYNQAIAYCLSFNLNRVIFVYENRDTCEKKAYLYEVTEEMKQTLKDRIKLVDGYLAKYELPPKEECSACKYCPYKKFCDANINIKKKED